MTPRTSATILLRLVALASLVFCVCGGGFAAEEITLPGTGTVVLGQDDALELILKPNVKADDAHGALPQLRAWLIASGQTAPKEDAPESARALIWPSPTRANEYIAHLRGLAAQKKDDDQAYDVLLRWSFPGSTEHGEALLKKAVAFRTGMPSVVLLLDGSGSMTTSDPEKSRIEAARRFIATGKTSGGIGSIGIIQFATQVHELLPLTPIADDDKFQRALKSITADGFTDIDGSIRKAVDTLRGPAGKGTGAIVLLTDGVQEPGVYNDAHRLARDAGIPIHTVALGPDADRDLLQRIADDTGGTFSAAASGPELIRIYGAIAAGIVGGRTIVSGPFPAAAPRSVAFPIDSTCRTLVASVASESSGTLALKSPKGENESTDSAAHPVYHKISPQPGTWTAQWSSGSSAKLEASAHTSLYPLFFRATAEATGVVEIDPDDPRIGLSLTEGATPLPGATVELTLDIADRSDRLTATLFDDGAHEDGGTGDGLYAGFVTKLSALNLSVGTTGTISAVVSGKRAAGEEFRREVHTHWTLVRGSARGLVVPHALDLGTHFAGESVTAELPVRVRGPGGNYRFTSKPAAAANTVDLSKSLTLIGDNRELPSREAATLPLQLALPENLAPGTYSGVIELELDGDARSAKVSALVPWHVRVKLPELALSRFALLDLGSVAPGATVTTSLQLATRGGRTRLAGADLNDCWLWTSLLRLPSAHASPLSIPLTSNLKLTTAPQPLDLDEHTQKLELSFVVSPDSRTGIIEREITLHGSGSELGRVLVRVDVLPQWFELGGDVNFGQLEPGDAAQGVLPWQHAGAVVGAPGVTVTSVSREVTVDATKPGETRLGLKLANDVPAGPVSGVITLNAPAADAVARWTATVVQPELNLSTTALDLGSIYPGQSRKQTFHATFKGVRPTPFAATAEAPPTKPLVRSIHLADDALSIKTLTETLQPGGDAEVALELHVPDSAQDGIYKTRVKVESRLGAVFIPVAFQVVYPIPLPPFHVTPIDVVLNVFDGQPDKPVTVTVFSQSDEPLPIRVHCEPTAGLARISAEVIRDGEAAPEKSFVLPGRGDAKFHIRALPDTDDGDQCLIVVESGLERQTVHATVVYSRRISAVPQPRTEGFDWWTLLIIIPLMICAVFVRKLVKRRWVRVAAYSGLLHFGLFFFIIIPQSHKDDSFGSVEASQGIDIDLTKLDDGGATNPDDGAAGGNDAPAAAAGPRGGDGLAALANAADANGALAGLKDGGNGPGGPAAAAAIQKAGAGDAAPAGGGPAFQRGPSVGGPDEALAMNDDPGGAAPLEPAAKPEPAGAPAAAHVLLTQTKIELPAGRNGPGTKQAASAAAAKTEAGGGNPDEKIILVGAPGTARGDGQPLAMDDLPLIADAIGSPAPDAPKLESRGPKKSTFGEPSAPASVASIAATSNPGASALGPELKNSAPATRYISGTSGAVKPENGKAWGDEGAERGSAVAGTESNRKSGLLVGRGDDDALDAGPILGEGLAASGNSGKTNTGSGAGGTKDGASISGASGAGLGGEGTDPRGGHGVTTALGSGRGLGSGEGLGGSGSGSGDGIGRGAGPGNHGYGGPGGLGTGYGGKGDGTGIAGRALGSGRGGSGTGTGGAGFGNGHGIGDAPLDLGGNGSGNGGNGNGNGSGTGKAVAGNGAGNGAGSGNGTGTGVGNGEGGPGSPRGIPGGLGTLGGRGTGGNDIGIASGGSGHGLGMGSQTGGVATGLGNGLAGSNGESLTSRSIGSGRGTGSGSGRPGPGDAPLDTDPLGAVNGVGTIAQNHGNGTGIGNGKGIGDEGPPGPRGSGLGTSGLSNGKGTGGGGTALAGLGTGSGTGWGSGHGPANGGFGTGSGTSGVGFGASSGSGKASVQAALDGMTLDRGGKNSGAALAHAGAETHDRPHWGPPTGTVLRVNLGLAQHAADWNSSPTALFNLATAFRERCGLPDVEADVSTVKLDDPKGMAACRFLLFTANYAIPFTDAEILSMRKYAENGGTLWFNDSGASGDERFDIALRKDLVRLFPGQKLETLESTHPLFHSAYDLTHGYKGYRIPPGDKYRQEFMEGITFAGRDGKPRTALIYTRNDYADGLEIDPRNIAGRPSLTDLTADEMLEGSLRFGVNLLAYSLGSDAPAMPPPPESAAQFEKIYRYNGPPLKVVDAFANAVGPDEKSIWSIQEWGNPAKFELTSSADGIRAIKIVFQGGDKMKAAAGRNVEMNLGTASSIVVDIHSSLPHGFNVALLFSTKPDWLGYESRPIFIRPGWNRNVRFPLNLDDFKTAKNDWKVYDQPFKPRESVGHIDFLLYNLNESGDVKIESMRVENSN